MDFIDHYTAIRAICGWKEPSDEEIIRYLARHQIYGEVKDGKIIAYPEEPKWEPTE